MMFDNKGVSIIVCCFNSASRLPETIKHLALQEVPDDIPWELIVVNNNSTDNTTTVALTEIQKYESLTSRSKVVHETQPGLSHARHKGVDEADYEYVIFCDDDNWLEKKYLTTAYEILSGDEKIAAAGGQSEAVSNVPFPDWWEDYKDGYAVGKQAEHTGDISFRKYLWGSGLAFKKKLYLKAFEKCPSLLSDRKGKELSSGGDSEICMRFLLMGYRLYYDKNLKFKHYIEPNRLIWDYRKILFQGFTDASKTLSVYVQYLNILDTSDINRLKNFLKNTLKIFLAIIFRKKEYYTLNEANFIFFVTGFRLSRVSPIARSIKKFKLDVTK
jgi:glycosyltransferase involved in cell wall biosynthesis